MTTTRPATRDLPWSAIIPPAARARLIIVGALFALVYASAANTLLISKWLHDGNWSHGFLIPFLSLYFIATRRDEWARVKPTPNYLGAVILTGSLATYFVAAWRYGMAYPQALSMVSSLLGLTLLLGGWGVLRLAWFPICFLILAVPLPDSLYVELTMPLRRWASVAAATLLPMLVPGLHCEAQAVVIDYLLPGKPPGSLNVEEACSGMRLMMAFVTLGVSMAYLGERPIWQRVVMVLSCLPIAVVCNTIRVTVTGLLHIFGDRRPGWLTALGVERVGDLSQGTPHQVLGILMLVVALGLYALVGYVLKHLFIEDEADASIERNGAPSP